jgi:small subunit ribosomal protein S9
MAEETIIETFAVNQKQSADTAKKKAAPKRKSAAKKSDRPIEFIKSKRKSAVARASARKGNGKIRLNGFDINIYEPIELRRLMLEPLNISKSTNDQVRVMDIEINVIGGGQSSQAQAVRGAIAKSIVAMSGSDVIKKEFMDHDRFMIIDDARRVEPKKFKGPKARARFQKSYR